MNEQLDLLLTGERRITRHKALTFILYRLSSDGKPLPKGSRTSQDAVLVGWKDDPGDPVFISVGEPGRTPKEHVARLVAERFLDQHLGDAHGAPDYFIPPEK